MKVRENTGADLCLTFVDGHSIMLGAGEVSRELTDEEISDPYFAKALHARRVAQYIEPAPLEVAAKPEPEPEPEPEPPKEEEDKPKKKAAKKKSAKKSS
jgi:hypothetical protein